MEKLLSIKNLQVQIQDDGESTDLIKGLYLDIEIQSRAEDILAEQTRLPGLA